MGTASITDVHNPETARTQDIVHSGHIHDSYDHNDLQTCDQMLATHVLTIHESPAREER
jgi:hypothetical protein